MAVSFISIMRKIYLKRKPYSFLKWIWSSHSYYLINLNFLNFKNEYSFRNMILPYPGWTIFVCSTLLLMGLKSSYHNFRFSWPINFWKIYLHNFLSWGVLGRFKKRITKSTLWIDWVDWIDWRIGTLIDLLINCLNYWLNWFSRMWNYPRRQLDVSQWRGWRW